MLTFHRFSPFACLPHPDDNCAVATTRLEAGSRIDTPSGPLRLPHTVLEGHRFAIRPLAPGHTLTSWARPFGTALRPIAPGDYICNQGMLEELHSRALDFPLPTGPNLQDFYRPYVLDAKAFSPGRQVPPYPQPGDFEGFLRSGGRGAGTRNFIVILGTTSRTASFARRLADTWASEAAGPSSWDGVVAVAHTEGGLATAPNNLDYLLRTLAGFVIHPNVGAVLVVDDGQGPVNNRILADFLRRQEYPLDAVLHRFLTLSGRFAADLAIGRQQIADWIPQVGAFTRARVPLASLKLALQCGGSDAFSGVTANPLIGWVAREAIRHGGSANLAETDELVGAEAYVLQNVRDLPTAERFLHFVAEFKERMSWHGHSPEGNPSGGNRYRGLYNIVIKSLGAAMKRAPDVRLDAVIDYAERMSRPGYTFMNSPGNDLESIAGQVAAGCNLIFFTTGNGAITNFPFVPTIKVLTTSGRFELLRDDMDVNAGALLDGVSMEDLTAETFARAVAVASGRPTQGEKAGHHQVSIWRDWMQTDSSALPALQTHREPSTTPVGPPPPLAAVPRLWPRPAARVGLVVPASLCSSEVARLFARRLNETQPPLPTGSRFAALSHTEGCGVSGGHSQELLVRTLLGHLAHPLVHSALILEHGCEKVHNQYLRSRLEASGHNPADFGWSSIQLDGGIEASYRKAFDWFERRPADATPSSRGPLIIALATVPELTGSLAAHLRDFAAHLLESGLAVVIGRQDPLLTSPTWADFGLGSPLPPPSLPFAAPVDAPGLYLMETFSSHWVENLSALGATGAALIVANASAGNRQGHPFIPLLRLGDASDGTQPAEECDLRLDRTCASTALPALIDRAAAALSGAYEPLNQRLGNTDFQVCRGPLGVSV